MDKDLSAGTCQGETRHTVPRTHNQMAPLVRLYACIRQPLVEGFGLGDHADALPFLQPVAGFSLNNATFLRLLLTAFQYCRRRNPHFLYVNPSLTLVFFARSK